MRRSMPRWFAFWLALVTVALGAVLNGCLSNDSGQGPTSSLDGGAGAGDPDAIATADGRVSPGNGGHDGGQAGDAAGDAVGGPFVIGGHVTGLAGKGLVLQNNGGDDLTPSADGAFRFAQPVAANGGYFITVATQPTSPAQTCTVTNGRGVAVQDVTDVQVTCVTSTYTLGGTVVGLDATSSGGLVLANARPSGPADTVTVDQNGDFTFPTKLASGEAYAVTVQMNPSKPPQTCSVVGGTGSVVAGPVTSIVVNCTLNAYLVGGTVTGLAGKGLVLANGTSTVAVNANGTFAFASPIATGKTYAVTVATQPTGPSQTCTVKGGTGTMGSADVTSVAVTCATSTFPVGGTLTGLVGAGLTLQNGAETLALSANGAFAFKTPVASGGSYAITVATQPTSPWQTCAVTGGQGTVGGAAIASVAVTCTTNTYGVSVAVSGLAGKGLSLSLNGAAASVTSNGAFTFPTKVASGVAYVVGVKAQPTNPSQVCAVGAPSGTIAGADVSGIAVTCATSTFAVGGTISGLTGTGLTLTDNGGAPLSIAAGAKTFTFPAQVESGQSYAVAIAAQPSAPSQTCSVSGGTGTVVAGAVSSVVINCGTNAFTLGGTVSGLAGQGLVLQNGAATVAVNANGSFAFATPIASGSPYAVTVKTSPSNPTQTCSVSGGTGTMGGANVTSVQVACSTSAFPVGGAVSGLLGSGLVLEDNGADDLAIAANGAFAFATSVPSGSPYTVTVKTQPTKPWQTCTPSAASGNVGGGPVTSVQVACATRAFAVGGTVSGLAGNGLVLTLNGGSPTAIGADGTFTFATPIASGASYTVAVQSQPSSPTQVCSLAGQTGTIAGADVTNVAVTCQTQSYSVGGAITGLAGTGLTLTNNGADAITIPAGATSFTFPTLIASGQTYAVAVATPPSNPTQSCVVTGGQGSVVAGPVTGVSINCSTQQFTVGGTVTNLAGKGLVLQNGGQTLAVNASGSFAFPPVASGTAYNVTVKTQPTSLAQTCSVTAGSGTVGGSNVNTVKVDCVTSRFTVGGTVSGLAGSGLVLENNGADDVAVAKNGAFTFPTTVTSGAKYAVTVKAFPSNPTQTCAVVGTTGTGTVGNGPVTSVQVTCTTSTFHVGGSVSGLIGSGLVLQNNGASLAVGANGPFTFPTAQASGSTYAVTVTTQPSLPAQSCSVTNGSSTVGGGDVTNVSIACVTTETLLTVTPSTVDFGSVGWNTVSGAHTVTVTNYTSTTFTLSGWHWQGSPTGDQDWYNWTNDTCPNNGPLAPGASCSVVVTCKPIFFSTAGDDGTSSVYDWQMATTTVSPGSNGTTWTCVGQ
jgi:hypothetical protein